MRFSRPPKSSRAVGSSSNRAIGSVINARASRTRCCSPDDKAPSSRSAHHATPSRSSHSTAHCASWSEYECHQVSKAPFFADMTTCFAVKTGRISEARDADMYAMRGRTGRISNVPNARPSTKMSPDDGCRYNDRTRSRVVLPHPFGPRITHLSVGDTERDTESRMWRLSLTMLTLLVRSTGETSESLGTKTRYRA